MKFIINREIWLRGEGAESSFLHRDLDGKECCMGQCVKQLYPELTNRQLFCKKKVLHKEDAWVWFALLIEDRDFVRFAEDCYQDNDNVYLSEGDREKYLTQAAEKHGHELEFIN